MSEEGIMIVVAIATLAGLATGAGITLVALYFNLRWQR